MTPEQKEPNTKTVKTMNKANNTGEWVKDADRFEMIASDRYEAFLETLQNDDRFTFSIEGAGEDSNYGLHLSEGFTFIYTRRGQLLAKNMVRRLRKLGYKHFPDANFSINSHLYREL